MIHSYGSIHNIGHKAVADIFNGPVIVQEKVDGSQISFGAYPEAGAYKELPPVLRIRSKGAQLVLEAPDKMFAKGVAAIQAVQHLLQPGWTYRGEYLAKPKHNTLAYDRVPRNHIVLFDVDRGEEDYLDQDDLACEAGRLGFEAVPFWGAPEWSADALRSLLQETSFLGGQKIEGVVVKAYGRFDPYTKKTLMAKFVSEAFKETHAGEWKKENPNSGDIVDRLIAKYRHTARWAKAVQHLREAGKLEDSPRDIGPLMREVPADILAECRAEIEEEVWAWLEPKLRRGVTAGLPEWYKDRLVELQFSADR